jgi:(2Fe-2S) ferredoxin
MYAFHFFFCCNERPDDDISCAQKDSPSLYKYAKDKLKTMKVDANVRINKAGCLGRCEEGPTLVIYPEGVWYTYRDEKDIDEILDATLLRRQVVERLKI